MRQGEREKGSTLAANTLQGDLKLMPMQDLLEWIGGKQQSGRLTLVKDSVQKIFHLYEGLLEGGLRSNRREESYEHILNGAGLVDREQLVQAQRQSQERGIPLIRQLVASNILDQTALRKLQTQRLLLVLADVLAWEEGFFIFEGMKPEKNPLSLIRLSIDEAIAKARRRDEESREQEQQLDDSLFEVISQRIMGEDFNIPSPPKAITQIQRIMDSPDGSVHDVLKIVMADQVLTSKILKVVNSSFYSLVNPVASVQHAIVMVGFKVLLGIVTTTSLAQVSGQSRGEIIQFMRHSFKCAYVAKRLAESLGSDDEVAFVCGLLHDVGKMVLHDLLSEFEMVAATWNSLMEKYHIQAGVLLAAKWNLPEVVIEAIDGHHDPGRLLEMETMSAITYLADYLVHEGKLPVFPEGVDIDPDSFDVAGIVQEMQQVETFVDTMF
ncbi:MAG: HDOD domain-containing protein [Desulfuromonadaceae bacterium]